MQRSRLLHAVVFAGASWGAAVAGCSASESPTPGAESGAAPTSSRGDPVPTDAGATATDGARTDGGPEDAGAKDSGLGKKDDPGHVMPDGGAHDMDGGDGGWPPTK